MKNNLTVLPDDENRRKKMMEDISKITNPGKDIIKILAAQGKSNEEQIEDINLIYTYGLRPKNIKVHPNKVALTYPDGKTGKNTTRFFLQFEVLGSLVKIIEQRLDLFESMIKTYLYNYCNIGEYNPNYKLIDAQVKNAYIDTMSDFNMNEDEKNPDNKMHEKNINKLYLNLLRCNFTMVTYMIVTLSQMYLDKVEPICISLLSSRINDLSKRLKDMTMLEGKDEFYVYVAIALWKSTEYNYIIKSLFDADNLTDKNAIGILEIILGKENIADFLKAHPESILERKAVVNYVINNKYITEETLINGCERGVICHLYKNSKNADLLKYMNKEDVINLFLIKEINLSLLTRYVKISDVLNANIDSATKMAILKSGNGKRIFSNVDSTSIWNLYEQDQFNDIEMRELNNLRYMHTATIIGNYYTQQKRKIGAELGTVPAVSEEKLYLFFTPELVLSEISKNLNDEEMNFYKVELKRIYEQNGDNIGKKIIDIIASEHKDNIAGAKNQIFELYKMGLLSASDLASIELPSSHYIDYYMENGCNTNVLVEFYNNGLVAQDNIFELFEDDLDTKLIELISEGMNATVIEGLYSTVELIVKSRYGVLSFEDLAMIKGDIKTGINGKENQKTLMDMYLNDELTYSELYGLAEAGVISEEEANTIDNEYTDRAGIDAIMGRGLKGIAIDYLYNSDATSEPEKKKETRKKKPDITATISAGISRDLVIKFYKALGVNQIKLVDAGKCPVFEGYCLVPIPNTKVCILEGLDNSRTYIVPLKIILEQINNPGSELDLIGNARSRSQFNRNKKYIESANHSKNWARNVIKKLTNISPVMTQADSDRLISENQAIIKETEKSYSIGRGNKEHK